MPSNVFAQVAFQNDSLLAEDQFVNTFSFQCASAVPSQAELDNIVTLLTFFYQDPHLPGTVSLVSLMSASVNAALTTIKIYNRADLKPRTPIRSVVVNMGTTASSALPNEVALCLSFRGSLISGLDPKRRRGRVYLGPFSTGTLLLAVGDSRPTVQLVNAAVGAGTYLANQSLIGVIWQVWSTVLGTGTTVVAGHVDDSWDTMRSRGRKPTSRVTFIDSSP